MLRMEVYPVMNGVELWIHATCVRMDADHVEHKPERFSTYVSEEELDTAGHTVAITMAYEAALHEFPNLVHRCFC